MTIKTVKMKESKKILNFLNLKIYLMFHLTGISLEVLMKLNKNPKLRNGDKVILI